MKLRNKKTGVIITSEELLSDEFIIDLFSKDFNYFNSKLDKIQQEWEDYEEPKEFWYISDFGYVISHAINKKSVKSTIEEMKSIGNYFETKEEAEKTVEKLKAWKRLKDKGFRFLGYYHRLGETKSKGEIGFEMADYKGTKQDLELLFGGEE